MKITEDKDSGGHIITGYGKGFISVNETRYHQSLIITAKKLVTDWQVKEAKEITLENLRQIESWQPEVVLIGTGKAQIFPEAELMFQFLNQGIGYEVMDSAAACRTYNILMGDGRNVAAALLLP